MYETGVLQREECFYRLFNGLADAVLISERLADGTPGTYLEINEHACELLGFTREELLGLSPCQLNRTVLEDEERLSAILGDLADHGKTLFKTHLKHRDGHWVAVEISAQIFELDGRSVYFSIVRDISLRERYESAIQTLVRSTVGLTGQECLDEIVRNLCDWLAVDGALIALAENEQLVLLSAFLDDCPFSLDTLCVSTPPFSKVMTDGFMVIPAGDADILPDCRELAGIKSFIGAPIVAHDGGVVGLICAFSRQMFPLMPHVEELLSIIAARALSEHERMHSVSELAHREDMLRTIFCSTAEAIVGIDLDGTVIFCNPSAVKILGYGCEDDIVGKNFCALVSPLSVADKNVLGSRCPFITAIATNGEISNDDGYFYHRHGHQIPVEYWGHPMERGGRLIGGVLTFFDISRRKSLERQLQHSQRMEAIGTLTGGIAHDFNNILTVISGYADLLGDQLVEQPKLLARVNKIAEASERGSQLTHGLLAYSRKSTASSAPVDLNHLIMNVQEIFGRIIGETIDKHLILENEALITLGDQPQLEQVFVNLVTNARDAMRSGGRLTIRTRKIALDQEFCHACGHGEPGDYALITVADTGIGIPAEIQNKIFDPFFTTKDTGKGTGLGLATAWGIVKQHTGYLLVDSTPGEGALFSVYLPLSAHRLQPLGGYRLKPSVGGTELLLLVEDDPLVRETTEAVLTSAGYRVVPCEDADLALQKLRDGCEDFSLVVTDVVMPGLNGPEFYCAARTFSSIPFLLMSGYAADALREQGLVEEGVPLLKKPIAANTLLTEVRRLLDEGERSQRGGR
ncbi:MAG: hypothetical protein C0622_07130 [Desulfuromonas sp.]|nr:MAG: hypothetical protein C0622_07130 [Desulfuromonas sp.]